MFGSSFENTPSNEFQKTSTRPSSLLQAESFSSRVITCRTRCLEQDGRFAPNSIASISLDDFDERSLHALHGEKGKETGLLRITSADQHLKLPFNHFYPSYSSDLEPNNGEISRFLISPDARKGRATASLIEAAFRFSVSSGINRLFIDVVDGNLGAAPKSYEKHYGFQFTGHSGYDANYSCITHLMVLDGSAAIREVSERLTSRLLKIRGNA